MSKDGHEREDVAGYRNNFFLSLLTELEPTFERLTFPHEDSEDPVLIYPNLPTGVRPRVPITHDECTFNSKDATSRAGCRKVVHRFLIKDEVHPSWYPST